MCGYYSRSVLPGRGERRAFSGLLLALALSALPGGSVAADYNVTIDTASLRGDAVTLAFDFISGGAFSNTITISDFALNGTLGTSGPSTGSVTGTLTGTVTLSDASFFNEFLQGGTLGTTISFQLDATNNGPRGGALPDTFSFFTLDPTASNSLLTTTDPTGADSLFSLQIDGSAAGLLGNYLSQPPVSATLVPVATGVPEPGALDLLLLGFVGLACAVPGNRGRVRRTLAAPEPAAVSSRGL